MSKRRSSVDKCYDELMATCRDLEQRRRLVQWAMFVNESPPRGFDVSVVKDWAHVFSSTVIEHRWMTRLKRHGMWDVFMWSEDVDEPCENGDGEPLQEHERVVLNDELYKRLVQLGALLEGDEP